MQPLPTQLSGAAFLASRKAALLADAPRVGKTGAAILACDDVFAVSILVVTTASGRAVWRRAFSAWSSFNRSVSVGLSEADVVILSWGEISRAETLAKLLARKFDVILGDESHLAKSLEAKRTQAFYRIVPNGKRVWLLSGTPAPNALNDLYPMLSRLFPDRLKAFDGLPDVSASEDFLKRYCRIKLKKISNFRKIPVVIGSQNEAELAKRMEGIYLRRTQADVGITTPIYETLPLEVSAKVKRDLEASLDCGAILQAAEAGDTRSLEMHLGPLRRLTGTIKAKAVVEVVRDEMSCGLDKLVLMTWHKDVINTLMEELADAGCVRLDGSSSARDRAEAEQLFREDPQVRVFVGQIQAAGEAIDLSAAADLLFVESSLVPKDMAQASLRITNHTQKRQPRVRVAVLEGSIDEAVETVLLRKWAGIREVIR